MDAVALTLAAAFVLLAWVLTAIVIRNWGAGFPNRNVRCPHEDVRATVSTSARTKDGWGLAVERDVLACSLLPGGPVTCDKACLTQL